MAFIANNKHTNAHGWDDVDITNITHVVKSTNTHIQVPNHNDHNHNRTGMHVNTAVEKKTWPAVLHNSSDVKNNRRSSKRERFNSHSDSVA